MNLTMPEKPETWSDIVPFCESARAVLDALVVAARSNDPGVPELRQQIAMKLHNGVAVAKEMVDAKPLSETVEERSALLLVTKRLLTDVFQVKAPRRRRAS